MPDDRIAIGSMTWTVLEDDEQERAPAPICMASREWVAMYQADLEAHRAYVRAHTRTRAEERRILDDIYDAVAARTRANGMHMM